ncbi:rod shape-determining protein MreC [Asticcacaulis machinosus]|uniref:Cell shape-determining protein MreC n=1 Tax=Asticcacaulis machinosus TaxID=2984211 RepID=A0ABT5HPS8_9CAUL|nr:rod shape-determining protein MreC [Asticcacaulis machinosus]
MPQGDKHFEHLKLPVNWGVMALVAAVCIFGALSFLGDRREEVSGRSYGNRSGFDAAAGPASNVLATPAHVVGDGANWIDDYFFAVRENRILKKRVQDLSLYRDMYFQQKDISERYEKLLNLRTEPPVEMVTARSVSVSRGPFNNNRLIDAGSNAKIRFGNPVITDQGLVGRVVGVSPKVSRVLLITDVVSRTPIMIARSDARAVMSGDGGEFPRLDFVRGKDAVKKGDQILTSGDGGIFPRGLPVGEAVQGVDKVWRVKLYANRAPIDFVKILLYEDFSQFPEADQVLMTPQITELLPQPAIPQPVTAGAAGAASSAGVASSAAAPVSGAATSAAARPAAPRPAQPRPAQTRPAQTSATQPAQAQTQSAAATPATEVPF